MVRVLRQYLLDLRILAEFFEEDDVSTVTLVLNARGDVHSGAKVIDAIVEVHRNAWPAVETEFHDHVGHLGLVMPQINEGLLNFETTLQRLRRGEEDRHHRIPDGLDDTA